MKLLSVNLGVRTVAPGITDARDSVTGIDKRPADGPVRVTAVGPKGTEGSGLAGDTIGDWRHHGGTDQAAYAFAREDLDRWAAELGRDLPNGVFGENLTTLGLDVNGARIGERWRIGGEGTGPLLEVSGGRIPCRTFAGWLGENGWVKRFTREAAPGAYLRVIEPGEVRAGDPLAIAYRPEHDVTVRLWFRALTTERALLPRLLPARDALTAETVENIESYLAKYGS
jgi:MOSC domain-containing protein YiiM